MKHSFRLLSTLTLLALSAPLLAQQAAEAPVSPPTVAEPAPALETPVPASEAAPAVAELDRSALSYSNKWRIKFDNRADSDGDLTFLVVIENAEPVSIVVPIKKGTSENSIASVVKSTLKKSVPKGVKVERDDGEDVLVKYKDRFSLTLKGNTVKDLDINLDKE